MKKNEVCTGTLWDMTGQAGVITLLGAGGKTTSLKSLARELSGQARQCILTTTTKVYPFVEIPGWCGEFPPPGDYCSPCFWYDHLDESSGKWLGLPRECIDAVLQGDKTSGQKRFWVVEGDGARGQLLKCWAKHEPQIPVNTQCAVLVINHSLWGKPLEIEDIHRPELCPAGLIGRTWDAESLWAYLLYSPVFDPKYADFAWVVLLNTRTSEQEQKFCGETSLFLPGLAGKWTEFGESLRDNKLPAHLRIAIGNAREDRVQWYDLW